MPTLKLREIGRRLDTFIRASHPNEVKKPVLSKQQDINENPFEIMPVSLEAFLYETEYLSIPRLSAIQFDTLEKATDIYPAHIKEYLGMEQGHKLDIIIALWGKGAGKDTIARVAIARVIYLLLCLKSPQLTYGMFEQDSIAVINMAYSSAQAKNVFFTPLRKMLTDSPFFRSRFTALQRELLFDKNLQILSGNSSQEGFEGYNVIAGVLDEIDAFKTENDLRRKADGDGFASAHSAENLYAALNSSIQSRFPGRGKLLMLSYPRRANGFIIEQYNKAKDDPYAYRTFGATWDVNPSKTREDFASEYLRNPERADRLYACKATSTSDNFFRNRAIINEIFHVDDATDELLPGAPLNQFMDGKFLPGYEVPFQDTAERYIHVDIGQVHDSAAVTAVHLHQWIMQEGVRVPVIKVDFFAVLDPLVMGEVQIDQIRDIIRQFRVRRGKGPYDQKLLNNIGLVTFDQYQSADSRQILAKEGIPTDYQSVDRDDKAYNLLKELIYSRRLLAPGSALVARECRELVHKGVNKVDHPAGGSKDLADSLAGAVMNLYMSIMPKQTMKNMAFYEEKEFDAGY